MNQTLLKEIIAHIYANFAIIPSKLVDLHKTVSLTSPNYLLKEKLLFEEEDNLYHGKVWGCQMNVGPQEIKILLGDCTVDKKNPEYAMVVQPKNAPIYGLYLVCNTDENLPMIALSTDLGKSWLQCNTGLQATFLAAMEQTRELGMLWKECTDYDLLFKTMISFFKFHTEIYGNK